jgi:hypothetical protein
LLIFAAAKTVRHSLQRTVALFDFAGELVAIDGS